MGALLQIKVLEGTSGAWLLDMLEAFNDGDLHRYDELCTKHADTLNQLPQMVEHEPKLREKITILALTELIFRHPPPFSPHSASPFSLPTAELPWRGLRGEPICFVCLQKRY